VSWHGLALNVRTDAAAFRRIQPCGFDPDVMTRLDEHLAPPPSVDGLVTPLAGHLARALEVERDGPVRYPAEVSLDAVLS
jgi:lipoate-protein ligase B